MSTSENFIYQVTALQNFSLTQSSTNFQYSAKDSFLSFSWCQMSTLTSRILRNSFVVIWGLLCCCFFFTERPQFLLNIGSFYNIYMHHKLPYYRYISKKCVFSSLLSQYSFVSTLFSLPSFQNTQPIIKKNVNTLKILSQKLLQFLPLLERNELTVAKKGKVTDCHIYSSARDLPRLYVVTNATP